MNSLSQSSLEFNRWMVVVCGFIFFLFFGFADEAQKNYKLAINAITKRVGLPGYGTTNAAKINTVSSSFGYGCLCWSSFVITRAYIHIAEQAHSGLIPNTKN